jgi:hypothetical protein
MANLHLHLASLTQAVELALLTGDTTTARAYLQQATAAHRAAGAPSLHGHELAVSAVEVLLAEDEPAAALQQAEAWLATEGTRRVTEHARVLIAAAEAALRLGGAAQAQRAQQWLAEAAALPGLPVPQQAALLAARLRCARALGDGQAQALAAAHRWLAAPSVPVLQARHLQQAVQG